MWSSVSLPGSPKILVVDVTLNVEGWEHPFTDRLLQSLRRSELQLAKDVPLRLDDTGEFVAALKASDFNCLLLFGHTASQQVVPLATFREVLRSQHDLHPFFLGICSCPDFDAVLSEDILKSKDPVCPLAVAPLSAMTPREAGLFYLKFFSELKLHSSDSITGKMVWFSFSKARELLRRRRYSAKFGVRS